MRLSKIKEAELLLKIKLHPHFVLDVSRHIIVQLRQLPSLKVEIRLIHDSFLCTLGQNKMIPCFRCGLKNVMVGGSEDIIMFLNCFVF